jgi:hypothetical protein
MQLLEDNPQGSRLRGQPKNRWWNCVQTDINNCKITNLKERSKTELNGRRPLKRRRSALGCSDIEEEEEEEGEGGQEEEEKKMEEEGRRCRRRRGRGEDEEEEGEEEKGGGGEG